MATDKTYTLFELIEYAARVASYELAEYRFNNENDYRLKEILEDDVERAHQRLLDYREVLGISNT